MYLFWVVIYFKVFRIVFGCFDFGIYGLSFLVLKIIFDEVLRKNDIRCKEILDGFVFLGILE